MNVDKSFSAASLGLPSVPVREKPPMSSLFTTETFSPPSPPWLGQFPGNNKPTQADSKKKKKKPDYVRKKQEIGNSDTTFFSCFGVLLYIDRRLFLASYTQPQTKNCNVEEVAKFNMRGQSSGQKPTDTVKRGAVRNDRQRRRQNIIRGQK